MSVEENRNCPCENNNNVDNVVNENNSCNDNTRSEMMQKIKSYNFAIIELALYLDTHPDDEKALCLHNKYCKECKELKDKYQKVYGPLTINYPCNKWRWLEEPWPSFILEVTTYLQFFSLYNKKIYRKNVKFL